MIDIRLLERIRLLEKNPERRGVSDSVGIYRSVMNHLRHILNTRQGSAPIAEEFGMPDFTDLPSSYGLDTVRDLERTLQCIIESFEPRLADVRVTALPLDDNHLGLKFQITGRLLLESASSPVEIQALVSPQGNVSLGE
ncbi:type VI secretion system baseplate subunit TssE [Desulfocurvibacter africanus]|uniref:Type VI secretion system lysozyme-related protein n=1 Tax=Desulfocurvibacter africanus subsp. africanus str. Walvis Bay TaxID=690850 RepID=F3YX71_DESAF|nr:type VI secretion system baseplate subunit TssE [Desulfocurvibacter africanus]EGJ50569.1 type VI secretion system lysozyme-related protein [Desulfocurvibacter africanus subsp. africanus str. Walvis Bay]